MRNSLKAVSAVVLLGLVAGCTNGNSGVIPGYQSADLSKDKLQLAVGTATFSDGSIGLNVVTTFRQPNGLSATLLNLPTVTGPTGFTVPDAADAGTDAGTNHISGSPQTTANQTAIATTFGESGGAFAYGFAPDNSDNTGTAYFEFYTLPFYNPGLQVVPYVGGPPTYPYTTDGTYPSGFPGFPEGFTTFSVPPVAGTYNESVLIQSANTASKTIVAPSATLTSIVGLPVYPAPTVAEDGTGGLVATIAPPAGVTETMVNIADLTQGTYFTLYFGPTSTAVALPDTLGPGTPGKPTATLATCDEYVVTAIGFDYGAFEAAPPGNLAITPSIAGTNGQADVTTSDFLDNFYNEPVGGCGEAHKLKALFKSRSHHQSPQAVKRLGTPT